MVHNQMVHLCVCVCVCVCIYLVVVYRASVTLLWSCLCIYICLVFPSVDVHSLPSPLPSVHSKYLCFRENYFFVLFEQIPFCKFFMCSLKFLASPFLLNIRSFLFVSSRLFINLCIVIKSPLYSLLSVNIVKCISFNLSYVRFSNSGIIIVVILYILSNFQHMYFRVCVCVCVCVCNQRTHNKKYVYNYCIYYNLKAYYVA